MESDCTTKWKVRKFHCGQAVNELPLPSKKVKVFHYSKVKALKQHFKCYPAVQDHENL